MDEQRSEALRSLRERAASRSLIGLWDSKGVEDPSSVRFTPHLWNWDSVQKLLTESKELISLDDTDRRILILANPAVFPRTWTTNNLYVSYQLVAPGESAAVHRHTPSASRFILEGTGGYTVVEGEKCPMSRGDLILTPQGAWHDHGNDGPDVAIWVDVLDLPLVGHMGATKFDRDYGETDDPRGEPIRRRQQTVRLPLGHSRDVYGNGGLMPTFAEQRRGDGVGSPCYIYPWEVTRAALQRLADYDGDPTDGVMVRYIDPITGESVMPTMDFYAQMLRPGEETVSHRHTSSTVYCCLEGNGETVIDGEVFEWSRNDTLAVPTWAWHQHRNLNSDAPAFLYAVSDKPAAKALRLYREEVSGSTVTPQWQI